MLDRRGLAPVTSAAMTAVPASPDGQPASETALPDPRDDWALFLDVDGTLVELVARPEAIRVEKKLVEILTGIQDRLHGALAFVSGRPIETLDSHFAPLRLAAGGNHGLERRGADGTVHRPSAVAEMDEVRRQLRTFADAHEGCIVEDKALSVALHYRLCPQSGGEARALAEKIVGDLDADLVVQYGKMMVEVRPGNANKGTVIEALMKEPPFQGRLPVFIGDDVTDEAGFAVVNALGGHSIRVGDEAESSATYRIADVSGVIAWLATFAGSAPAR